MSFIFSPQNMACWVEPLDLSIARPLNLSNPRFGAQDAVLYAHCAGASGGAAFVDDALLKAELLHENEAQFSSDAWVDSGLRQGGILRSLLDYHVPPEKASSEALPRQQQREDATRERDVTTGSSFRKRGSSDDSAHCSLPLKKRLLRSDLDTQTQFSQSENSARAGRSQTEATPRRTSDSPVRGTRDQDGGRETLTELPVTDLSVRMTSIRAQRSDSAIGPWTDLSWMPRDKTSEDIDTSPHKNWGPFRPQNIDPEGTAQTTSNTPTQKWHGPLGLIATTSNAPSTQNRCSPDSTTGSRSPASRARPAATLYASPYLGTTADRTLRLAAASPAPPAARRRDAPEVPPPKRPRTSNEVLSAKRKESRRDKILMNLLQYKQVTSTQVTPKVKKVKDNYRARVLKALLQYEATDIESESSPRARCTEEGAGCTPTAVRDSGVSDSAHTGISEPARTVTSDSAHTGSFWDLIVTACETAVSRTVSKKG